MRSATAALAVLLAFAASAHADPVSTRSEDIETIAIDGSIPLGEIGGVPFTLSYRITITQTVGQYLVATSRTPGTRYTSTTACVAFESDFYSDSGCVKRPVKYSQADDLTRSSGSFAVKMRQARQKVAVSFSVGGTGPTIEERRPAHTVTPAALSAGASVNTSRVRSGNPKGTLHYAGYPKLSLKGTSATLSRATVVSTVVDA